MQRAHERIMLNITWRDHKTAEWIREQTKLRDILETISKAKWTWAGHLTRRTDNRWTTKLTFWQPRGHTRNKGRPKFRWRDDLDKFRKHWHRDASDRLRWRQMGKAYVQLRTFKGMRITRIDVTDVFSNANCQYHFGINTLDISYHLPIFNSS